jgi:hypothetical protein
MSDHSRPRRWKRRHGCALLLLLVLGPCAVERCDRVVRGPRFHREFTDALQAGLTGTALRGRSKWFYPALQMIVIDRAMTREEFVSRLRGVPDWDRIAMIGPYGSDAEDLLPEAAGFNPWLWLRIKATPGFQQDGVFTLLVIDGGHVVTTLYLDGGPPGRGSGVFEREP